MCIRDRICGIFSVAVVPVSSLFPLMCMSYFGGTAVSASVVETAYSLGMLAGSLLLGLWGGTRNKMTAMTAALFAMGEMCIRDSQRGPGGFPDAIFWRSMMKRKPILERVGDFMEGRGFYIVLSLCVAAIGISGYYLFSSLQPEGADAPVSVPTQVVVTVSPTMEAVKPPVTAAPVPPPAVTKPAPSPSPSAEPSAEPAPARTPAPSPSPAQAANFFVWPLRGQVVADWSLEVLAYDETMGDWRTHSGVDISAPVGTEVMAVADGTVASVEQDPLMGTTVTIAHADGLESVYANLAEVPAVEAGDGVKVGAVIGSTGTTDVYKRQPPPWERRTPRPGAAPAGRLSLIHILSWAPLLSDH